MSFRKFSLVEGFNLEKTLATRLLMASTLSFLGRRLGVLTFFTRLEATRLTDRLGDFDFEALRDLRTLTGIFILTGKKK
jgi:hypothetical protein